MLTTPYDVLENILSSRFSSDRLISDPLRTLAYGTDASLYRMVPKLVVRVDGIEDVSFLLRACKDIGVSVTFRAAGTSLSGQAVTDSVLAILGGGWRDINIADGGEAVTLGPGVIGADANAKLAPLGRKIGPDPASINAAMIGGIAANNASGMCCGTSQNSYRTVQSMKVVLHDGTCLDTGNKQSRANFQQSHALLLKKLSDLAEQTKKNKMLADRIRDKFKIKNTTGYSLNAFVDFDDPFDILEHLMIGSEGTLGFIAEITYRTVPEHSDKASALVYFETAFEAAQAAMLLKETDVSAVELIDRAGLRSVEGKPGMPDFLQSLPQDATALLIEVRAENSKALTSLINQVTDKIKDVATLYPVDFTTDAAECDRFWSIRKGLFPLVGAMRETGTTVIIEDVAFPIQHLAAGTHDLQRICAEHGYDDAIIFGHALEGNLHFVFTQDFNTQAEIDRYAGFMDAIADMVVNTYDGSLKAEHGTGRNMAPFVEMEWGIDAYGLMQSVKTLFDPDGILNPGVILNDNKHVHLENLKPMPEAHRIVDKCIECGFCEPKCPSRNLTLSPRQRIVGWRELARLKGNPEQKAALEKLYAYQGVDTCAACGLCATACPVGIETGALIKTIRGQQMGKTGEAIGNWFAGHYGFSMKATSMGLKAANLAHGILGSKVMRGMTDGLRTVSGGRIPRWTPAMPTGISFVPGGAGESHASSRQDKVIYLPSCASRTMGPARHDPEKEPLPLKTEKLLQKAGFTVVYPKALNDLCCGQPFDSKGLKEMADNKASEMEQALFDVSDGGRIPVVFDTSPCSFRMKALSEMGLKLYDVTEFIHDQVMDRLTVTKKRDRVLVHTTCSTRKMELDDKLIAIAQQCADVVVQPDGVGCCGFAGDKGFTRPELNAHALRHLPEGTSIGVTEGFSTSRTCEIGLSEKSGVPYRSIVYLVDDCTEQKQ